MKKWVYQFDEKRADVAASPKEALGGKGAVLSDMVNMGIPVPPGFTITTEACLDYFNLGNVLQDNVWDQVAVALGEIEQRLSLAFGDANNPLLVSVRSGARVSMPGMMDTVLNLGLNDNTVQGMISKTNNKKFAYDCYRRFIEMYGNVVLGIESHLFEEIFAYSQLEYTELTPEFLKNIIAKYKKLVIEETKKEFPQDPNEQLRSAICKVFESWYSERADIYRKIHDIPNNWGTAVNVQSMVFGNMGNNSGTGVAFTRNPVTGEKKLFGEFLIDAQGEDIVAGTRTPQQITIEGKLQNQSDEKAMEELMPEIFTEFKSLAEKLEEHYHDMQDIEFTIQNGKLWILQSRSGKRTAQSAIKIAVDLVLENKISKQEAIRKIKPEHIERLLHHTIDPKEKTNIFTKGLPASPGAASGVICFSSAEAESASKHSKVILVRHETSPEDIGGMNIAEGVLTIRGGMTSHAAVVARGMGKPCVCGASNAVIDYENGTISASNLVLKSGDKITINGTTGEIFIGEVPMIMPELTQEFEEISVWADETRKLKIRSNAETIADAKISLDFGAEGIGLCRTEHMFFHPERLKTVQKMILSLSTEERIEALDQLLPFQKEDFKGLFSVMKDKPVTIRLLDPPLHEFLPSKETDIKNLADEMGRAVSEIKNRIKHMSEINPMLGHRGCRIGITFPEIYEMQVKAVFAAVIELKKELGISITPEIMVPLVFDASEVAFIKNRITKLVKKISDDSGLNLPYLFGVMIELPRAALQADKIAKLVDFCSFGTNDLTQTTLGISRDDAHKFLGIYSDSNILKKDPFVSLDQSGVGELISIAAERSRKSNPKIKLGVCGEHGGDPDSIQFFNKIGLEYVSCSPYRVPVARLACASVVATL